MTIHSQFHWHGESTQFKSHRGWVCYFLEVLGQHLTWLLLQAGQFLSKTIKSLDWPADPIFPVITPYTIATVSYCSLAIPVLHHSIGQFLSAPLWPVDTAHSTQEHTMAIILSWRREHTFACRKIQILGGSVCAYVMNHLPVVLTARTPSTLSPSWELFL